MTGLVLAVLFLSCLGGGAAVLNGLGLWRRQPALERGALAFAVGFGVVGWLAFWIGTAGVLSPGPAWGMCGVLCFGLVFWNRPPDEGAHPFTPAAWLLLGVAAVVLVFDLLEAASPPIEADTLSYHFELPRQFVEGGRVFFVPRALSGATPLIVQMTYAVALALGPAESADALLSGWTLIPVSVGGIGTRDAAIVAYLALLGIAPTHALAFSIVMFGVFHVGGAVIGLACWWMKGWTRPSP